MTIDQNVLTVAQLKALDRSSTVAFSGVFILRRVTLRTAKNDNPFLSVDLGDKTGTFSTTVFGDSSAFATFKAATEGDIVRIEAKLGYYNEQLSPKIQRAEGISLQDVEQMPGLLDRLIESSPIDADALWEEFQTHIAAISHPELRATVESVFEEIGEVFRTVPAAVLMHHAYRNGLIEHTTRMARACRALAPLYPEVSADLALAGILLHDTGKTIEYTSGFSARRTRRGLLQGHVVLGYQLARKHGLKTRLNPDLLERLEHIILSHQGELEWGAAVMASTPEAVFVSMIDNLDARMGIVQRMLRQAGDEEFSEKHPALKTQVLLKCPMLEPPSAS